MYTNRISIRLDIEFETDQKISKKRLLEMLDQLAQSVAFGEVSDALIEELREQEGLEDVVSWNCFVPKAKASDVASSKEA